MKTMNDIPAARLIFEEEIVPFFKVTGNTPLHCFVGSVAIIGEGNDLDLLVLVPTPLQSDIVTLFATKGNWELGSDTSYPTGSGGFESLKRDGLNLLLVDESKMFLDWIKSAQICRGLKLTDRRDRVAIHQVIMDGISPHEAFSHSWGPIEIGHVGL